MPQHSVVIMNNQIFLPENNIFGISEEDKKPYKQGSLKSYLKYLSYLCTAGPKYNLTNKDKGTNVCGREIYRHHQ